MNDLPDFKITPMYEQYLRIKEEHPDALLFYRMGDFYELFFEDAKIAARELSLTLTSRHKDDSVPMCGVPWHAVNSYILQLTDKGYRVAVCDQIEDPRTAKGLVKRKVTRIETAGTSLDDNGLEAKSCNYLSAFYWNSDETAGGFAWVDVSTGAWSGLQSSKLFELWQWVFKLSPRELLLVDQTEIAANLKLHQQIQLVRVPYRGYFEPKGALDRVLISQGAQDAAALGLDTRPQLAQACGALVAYLINTQQQSPQHLQPFQPLDLGNYLILDEITERNLELFQRLDGRKGVGTLWHVLDNTRTPMGGRLLAERMRYPWRSLKLIEETQDVVEFFVNAGLMRTDLAGSLDLVYDLERLSTRINLDRCQPRDLGVLRDSLEALPKIQLCLSMFSNSEKSAQTETSLNIIPPQLQSMLNNWDNLGDVYALLQTALVDDLPLQVTDGGLFKFGFNQELDELLELVDNGEAKLRALLTREQKTCNLPKLKLGYNRVFGYYFELSKSQLSQELPEHFQRRQTLATGERFVTSELKELEDKLLNAFENRKSLEYKMFQDLRLQLAANRERMMFVADVLAHLDYWQCLAFVAFQNGWTRPEVHSGREIAIKEGRHPVVEAVLGKTQFIPNDLHMDDRRHLLLITGPNMAGKSTVLRQSALLCMLAQMGSFVPAAKACIGLVDRIFSRVGASDNLAQGQSTFMVEMMETARILRQAGKRSLVILDEIGRGTSTFDGLAIAWAVVEELTRRHQGEIRTLFATHYHELTELEGNIDGVVNLNIAVTEHNNDIVFLHRLVPGAADRRYGIEVAKLAGVPMPVVQRAKKILELLENTKKGEVQGRAKVINLPGLELKSAPQPMPTQPKIVAQKYPLQQVLDDLDPDSLTPLGALKLLSGWKMLWGEKNEEN